jgi:MFS family permease
MWRAYRDLFAIAGVGRLAAAAVLSRLTTSMLSLSLLLAVADAQHSYAGAGAVLTGHALALAMGIPLTGRLADLHNPRPVLLGCLAGHALAYVGLLVALDNSNVATIALAAAAVGASTPPAAPVTRGQWPRLVTGDRLRSAYAFDGALNSATFIAGPLLAGGLMLVLSPYAAAATAGLAKILGDLLLASTPSLSDAQPRPRRSGQRLLGALANARVRLLLSVAALDTFTYGSLQVGAAALTHGRTTASLLIAALALGEIGGSLAYGANRWSATPRLQLMTLHFVTALVLLTTGLAAALTIIAVLYLTAGATSGARDTLNQITLGDAAAPGWRTETFAWLSSVMWIGYALGTTTAGQVQARLDTADIFIVAAAAALAATLTISSLPRLN